MKIMKMGQPNNHENSNATKPVEFVRLLEY